MLSLRLVDTLSLLRIVQRHAKYDEWSSYGSEGRLGMKMSDFCTLCEKEDDVFFLHVVFNLESCGRSLLNAA